MLGFLLGLVTAALFNSGAAVAMVAPTTALQRNGGAADSQLVHVLTISGQDAGFGHVKAIAADSRGRIFVADDMAQQILVFDSLGDALEPLGRTGEGPGEFRYLRSIGVVGRTLVALDSRLGRITFWPADGDVFTRRWPGQLGYPSGLIGNGVQLYAVGHAVRGQGTRVDATTVQFPQPWMKYARILEDGSLQPFMAVQDTATEKREIQCKTGPHIIGMTPFFPTGPLRAFPDERTLAVTAADNFAIDLIELSSGRTVDAIVQDLPRARVNDRTWHEATREFRDAEEQNGRFRNCQLDEMRPDYQPAIRAMVADDEGRLWVEVPTADGHHAIVFESGVEVGKYAFPRRDPTVAPVVANGRVYVTTVDLLGVQSIEVYRVAPGG